VANPELFLRWKCEAIMYVKKSQSLKKYFLLFELAFYLTFLEMKTSPKSTTTPTIITTPA